MASPTLARRFLPRDATGDARILVQTRAFRAVGDGLLSVVLVSYLTAIGLSETRVGVLLATTMFGSAALTLFVGFRTNAFSRRRLLQLLSLLMIATGAGFATFTTFWPLILVALIGTLNPSGGDVSAFLPTEQALLPATVSDANRTRLFARYTLIGSLGAALGAAFAGVPEFIGNRTSVGVTGALRWTFLVYVVIGVIVLVRYGRLTSAVDATTSRTRTPLGPSKRTVYKLAALFSLDSFGGGFTITAIIVLWLQLRFDLSVAVSGAVFFWAGLLAALSQLLAPKVADRIGLIRTMVFSHLPANGFLILAAFMPNAGLAVGCLLFRSALSQMDVPARTSYVMAVVTPEERPAASSVTNVPRSLAAALPPIAAGWLLSVTDFGWPLVIGGTIKAIYDLLLLREFRNLRPPEEQAGQ